MGTEYAKILLEILKLAPRYVVSLGVVAALLLFGGDDRLKQLGVYDFAQNNRAWIGLVLIVTATLFVVDRSIAIFGWMRGKQAIAKASERRLKRLHSLTEEEKQILRFYFVKQTKTNYLRIDDGVVQGLVSAGIIYLSASVGDILDGFAYNIRDFAWDYLQKNIDLLEGTTNTYRTDKGRDGLDYLLPNNGVAANRLATSRGSRAEGRKLAVGRSNSGSHSPRPGLKTGKRGAWGRPTPGSRRGATVRRPMRGFARFDAPAVSSPLRLCGLA